MNEPAQAEGAKPFPNGTPRPPHAVVPRRAREAYWNTRSYLWCLARLIEWRYGRRAP